MYYGVHLLADTSGNKKTSKEELVAVGARDGSNLEMGAEVEGRASCGMWLEAGRQGFRNRTGVRGGREGQSEERFQGWFPGRGLEQLDGGGGTGNGGTDC